VIPTHVRARPVRSATPALRTARTLLDDRPRDGGFHDLVEDCAARLRARLARPPRADEDWTIEPPDGCACELCGTLDSFLRDPAQRTFEWPLAQQRRGHIHSRIDAAELPVRHETRRQDRPYTLVLTKSPALFERERKAQIRDQADLARSVRGPLAVTPAPRCRRPARGSGTDTKGVVGREPGGDRTGLIARDARDIF